MSQGMCLNERAQDAWIHHPEIDVCTVLEASEASAAKRRHLFQVAASVQASAAHRGCFAQARLTENEPIVYVINAVAGCMHLYAMQ